MSHDDKLKLATAMAQTSTEASGAHWFDCGGLCWFGKTHVLGPFVSEELAVQHGRAHIADGQRANGTGPEIDERLEPLVAACREGFEPLGPFTALIEAAQMMERQRIRAIVFRLLGNEWTANRVLEEIDRG